MKVRTSRYVQITTNIVAPRPIYNNKTNNNSMPHAVALNIYIEGLEHT